MVKNFRDHIDAIEIARTKMRQGPNFRGIFVFKLGIFDFERRNNEIVDRVQ